MSNVTIHYRTEYGSQPPSTTMTSTEKLTSEHLPSLEVKDFRFAGWVHVNTNGHESSLSERMTLSTEWLIPTGEHNEYYVVFTAKWVSDRKTAGGTGDPYAGDYIVIPKVTEQVLPTSEKYMEDDVTIKSIPYFEVSNTAGGGTVYIGSEL